MVALTQPSLFAAGDRQKPAGDAAVRLRVLVTVKAAPNPSDKYGETVCVAGLRLDPEAWGWVRLYPLNFRELDDEASFRKYDVITVSARPARGDGRSESWRPQWETIEVEDHLPPWTRRQRILDEFADDTACGLLSAVRAKPLAPSLGMVRPAEVRGLEITPHPGWTKEEQRKIDAYVQEIPLVGTKDRRPLEAPRFRGKYHYRCRAEGCKGRHRQGLLDWEWVAFQRKFPDVEDMELVERLRARFLGEMCRADKDVAFYLGNQAKHVGTFSVLGVYWPSRRKPRSLRAR